MIKHSTASVFVFARFGRDWRLGLIEHPRLGRVMIVGGHVEADETAAEAAVRETLEESGLRVRLLGCPSPALPADYPHAAVPAAWWVNEIPVPADNHLGEPHVHVDHQYVAIADSVDLVAQPVHAFRWYVEDELAGLPMFTDTVLLARVLFGCIDEVAVAAERDDRAMLRVLAAAGLT